MEKFEKLLGRDSPLLPSIRERGFEEPSEIQEKSIPEILKGRDVIAGASTGSGKTLAFASGLIRNVSAGNGLQGLILTPTRELAEQVAKELTYFSKELDLYVIPVFGGVGINPQIKQLTKAEIVVATPGRMLDHIERNSINLGKINTIVLDEADRMLDMGFRDDVRKILNKCPRERQTLLFSATISQDVIHLAKDYMKNPVEVSAEPNVDPKKLAQVYYDVRDNLKFSLLKHLLEKEKSDLIIVFCNTRKNVDFLVNNLRHLGIETLPIHGGITQDKRSKTMENFHSKKTSVLIATDVAARGLHIEGISHVYNYDAPLDKKDYIHRIGRTARAGKEGKVINIISMRDYENFNNLRPKELGIVKEETPHVETVMINWIPGRSRGGNSPQRFGAGGPRSNSRGRDSGRSSGRSSSGRSYGGSSREGGRSSGRSSSGRSSGGSPHRRSFREDGSRDAGRGRSHSFVKSKKSFGKKRVGGRY